MLDRIDTAFQAEKSFISNASHELNNPLTAIQGECEDVYKRQMILSACGGQTETPKEISQELFLTDSLQNVVSVDTVSVSYTHLDSCLRLSA